jgi:hypothetical protein
MTELGARVRRGGASLAGGHLELLGDDPVAAERELREGFRLLDEMGERALLSTVAFELADTLCRQGRFQEAEELTHASEEASAEAMRLTEPTDALVVHAHTLVIRAEVLRLGSAWGKAATALEEAIGLYERKVVPPAIERTRALLSELTG